MPSRSESRVYTYNNTEVGAFRDGDHVTVIMANGCTANGTVTMRGIGGYGITSPIQNNETREIVYTIKITSGSSKGLIYRADEHQLTHGWSATGISETCGNGGAAEQHATAPSTHESGVADLINDPAFIVFVATVAFLGVIAATRYYQSTPHAA